MWLIEGRNRPRHDQPHENGAARPTEKTDCLDWQHHYGNWGSTNAMSNTFNLETVIAAAPDQVSANLDGEDVILNLETGTYYGLHGVGGRIWSFLEEPRSVAAIKEAILAEFDVEPEQCLADLMELLGDLAEAKLIVIRNQ